MGTDVLKILITGANGMLGSSLCRLFHKNHKVYAFHREKECFSPCESHHSIDLTNSTHLKSDVNQINPDLIIHCAGMINMDICEKKPDLAHVTNVTVVRNIAHACSNKTKLVHISTDQVYGDVTDHSEKNANLNPVNQYGKTKLLGEQKVKDLCSDHIIIRTNIFGWNVKPKKISSAEWIYSSLKNGLKIKLFIDYIFSPIYTSHLGKIIMQLIDINFKGVINVGSPKPCSKYDFGIDLASKFGFDQSFIEKGLITDLDFDATRVCDLALNVERLSSLSISIPTYTESIQSFFENKS